MKLPRILEPFVHRLFLPAAGLGLLLALGGSGCSTTDGSSSGGIASVTITNHTAAEIAAATVKVFGADGYRGGTSGARQMTFEKAASVGTTISRDGIAAAQSGARTIIRARVEIVDLDEKSHRLQCEAFHVSGAGDAFFEEQHRLSSLRSGPYQSLLNKVKEALK